MSQDIIKLPDRPRILVARTDRIGDVVLSLPVFTSLKTFFPRAYLCALTRSYTKDLLLSRPDVDEVISFDSKNAAIPFGEFPRLLKEVRKRKFDAAVILYSNFSVAALAAMAGIPCRVGPASKVAQVFLTQRVIQRRSKNLVHEADHNLNLLKPFGVTPIRVPFLLAPKPPLILLQRTEGRPLIGVHPGHGGSSRNWPEERYAQLCAQLYDSGCDVVVTGSAAEKPLVERIVAASGKPARKFIGSGPLPELVSALSQLDVFVASSTGPLHIASAVGTPVVGLYCPIFACLPQRWGPIGPKDTALSPKVEPCMRCTPRKCLHFDCMEKIEVRLVRDAALGKVSPVMELAR
ncbi:MAG: glycosyltransferase family 9 protein [Nitrospinae bacterium]|nr:glycosyltransferase family 9 protein [Nitrospinota bacterium]